MPRVLYWASVAILVILSALSYSLGTVYPEGGLWFNIFAELVGTIIGITYVQYMIDAINKNKWKKVDKAVQQRLLNCANQLISTIRIICEMKPVFTDVSPERLGSVTLNEIAVVTLTALERKTVNQVTKSLSHLTVSEWASLPGALRECSNAFSELILLSQANPDPGQIEQMLVIQSQLHKMITTCSTFGELFGSDRGDLPVSETLQENQLINLRDTFYAQLSADLLQMLATMKALLQTIKYQYSLSDS